MCNQISINGGNARRKRIGPFGPAIALLPYNQELLTLKESTLASDALERMVDNRYSQIPVKNDEGIITGVFTWQSFGKRVADLQAIKLKPTELPIRDAMETANFIDPDVYIDTETDWGNIDYVLVGTEDDLIGILCISDVLGRLNDFAEAFVLLYEIENEIRDLIRDVYNDNELNDALESVTDSVNRDAVEAEKDLRILIEEGQKNKAIGKAIKVLHTNSARKLESLEDFTFSQYQILMCSERNWQRFEPVFMTMREIFQADLKDINDLRNIVFHFRRRITPKDTDRLRRFRDRLLHDRKLFLIRKEQMAEECENQMSEQA